MIEHTNTRAGQFENAVDRTVFIQTVLIRIGDYDV